jgi:hypothetical protein
VGGSHTGVGDRGLAAVGVVIWWRVVVFATVVIVSDPTQPHTTFPASSYVWPLAAIVVIASSPS